MLKQTAYLKRSKPPRKKRPGTRKGQFRSESKRRFVASQPCILTGNPNVQCCHITHNGMASKGSDEFTIPLIPALHDQLDGRVKLPNGEYGNRTVDGKKAFEVFYDVDLLEHAIRIHCDWMVAQKLGKVTHGNGIDDAAA